MSAVRVLQEVFGYQEFRPLQREVIEALLAGRSSLAIMPTGAGKSLCFQIPALMRDGLTVVVSPLIALMKDQVDAAKAKGIAAEMINSSLSRERREQVLKKLHRRQLKILYATPERFRQEAFWEALLANEISFLAVDEAHCISTWGHDFRVDFTRLKDVRQRLGSPCTLAVTATATPETKKDILEQLGLDNDETLIVDAGIARPQLGLRVQDVWGEDQKLQAMLWARHQWPGPAIIYFSLIDSLERARRALESVGTRALVYHSKIGDQQRRRMQEEFLASDHQVMLATPAFGLGVDKPDIRLIVHAEIPGSPEAYYQEVGRAGRDGKAAEGVMLYAQDDLSIQTDFIKWANPDPAFIRTVYQKIKDSPLRARQEGYEFLRREMHFYHSRDFRVETSVNLLERWGVLAGHRSFREWEIIGDLDEADLDFELHETKLKTAQKKLYSLVQIVQSTECRMVEIATYFGYGETLPCGRCDQCLAKVILA